MIEVTEEQKEYFTDDIHIKGGVSCHINIMEDRVRKYYRSELSAHKHCTGQVVLSFLGIAPNILSAVQFDETIGRFFYDSERVKVVKHEIDRDEYGGPNEYKATELYGLCAGLHEILDTYGLSYFDIHLGNIGLLGNNLVILDSGSLG